MSLVYPTLAGGQADKATVEENMQRLVALLKKHGQLLPKVLVVGDWAMPNNWLVMLYDEKGLRYLGGLTPR